MPLFYDAGQPAREFILYRYRIQVNYDAWPIVKLENQFNSPPKEDKRMVMVTLTATNVAGDNPTTLSASNFCIMGEYQTPYSPFDADTRCGVVPERLFGKIRPGETIRGNVCIQVPINEGGLVLVYDGYGSDNPKMYFLLPGVLWAKPKSMSSLSA